MITQDTADRFAAGWIEAWNTHDLDRIVSHYADGIEFVSPFVVRLLNDPAGCVHGRAALRDYFAKGLANNPDLRFELRKVLPGVGSVTLCYRSIRSLLAAEVMELDGDGKIRRVLAHYTPEG